MQAQMMQANVDFNPRSREGSDGTDAVRAATIAIFQSTLP